jgi:hypothetical protein
MIEEGETDGGLLPIVAIGSILSRTEPLERNRDYYTPSTFITKKAS